MPDTTLHSTTLWVTIAVPVPRVREFASDPRNLPQWVPSFCKSVSQEGDHWIVQSPAGPVRFAFVEPNTFGVLDHTITFGDGRTVTNPMRVLPCGQGSLVMFTLFQVPGMGDAAFEADAELVHSDLQALKRLMERGAVR